MHSFIGIIGVLVMMLLAWSISENKKKMDMRVIGGGLALQCILAIIVLKTDFGVAFFQYANDTVLFVLSLSDQGAKFVFGNVYQEHFFAFKVLPTIIFVSSLSYCLFYLGVMQKIVAGMGYVMVRVMNISGSESLVAAANVFCGQTEAPLFVKPYLKSMTRSEITSMMTSGMATVAGGVMAAFVGLGISAGHLLAASIMSAPAAVLIAKIICPETEESPTKGRVKVKMESDDVNILDAACRGASDGLLLALNVGAMLIAVIALVALLNAIIGQVAGLFGASLTFEEILGFFFWPLAFVMGIPWSECEAVGRLLGEKMVLNEFIAYIHLSEMIKEGTLSERSISIATYALCGFANFSSIAIQIGGIGKLEPGRKKDFAKMGLKAMLGGSLAAFMTACIAGILI